MLAKRNFQIFFWKWLLYHILTMITFCFILSIIAEFCDCLIYLTTNSIIEIPWGKLWIYYWLFSLVIGYANFLFIPFIIFDFVIRWFRLDISKATIISVVLTAILGIITANYVTNFYNPFRSKIEAVSIFILAGLIYPQISKKWENIIRFIRYDELEII